MSYDFDWSVIGPALPFLMQGLRTTLILLVAALSIGVAFGTLLAALRTFGSKGVAQLAGGYVNFFRSMPLILTIFWMYFLMPFVLRTVTGNPYLSVGGMWSGIVALGLAEAAYFCEIIRSGIGSVRGGQLQAARALGLSTMQSLAFVVLPQAFRNMTPALINETIGLFKDTSLVNVISLNDFLSAAGQIGQRDGRVVEFYLFAALFYLLVCSAGVALAAVSRRRLTGQA